MKKWTIAASIIFAVMGSVAYAGAQTFEPSAELDTPAVSDSIPDWSGFYMGLQGGYGWRSNTQLNYMPRPTDTFLVSATSQSFELAGGVYGGQMGYLWQVGEDLDYIAGVEASLNGSSITGLPRSRNAVGTGGIYTSTYHHVFSGSEKMPLFGSLRPLLGFLMDDDTWLVYGTGGMAYALLYQTGNADFSGVSGDGRTYSVEQTVTQLGWVAGGGGEWKFARHVSSGIEYLYYDLGSTAYRANGVPNNSNYQVEYRWNYKENVLTVNLNYRFL